jgi:hypothetical protein
VSEAELDPADPLARALLQWQDTAGPWWPYVCATPFLSDLSAGEPKPVAPRLPTRLARALPNRDDDCATALFVDLAPETTLAATPVLCDLGYAVVPVIQRWAAAPAVVRSETLVARLVTCAPRARLPARVRGVVFLLDGRRFGPARHSLMEPQMALRARRLASLRRFDNRYQYPICRFPPVDLLQQLGIQRTIWVADGFAPDLQGYITRLESAGMGPPQPSRAGRARTA